MGCNAAATVTSLAIGRWIDRPPAQAGVTLGAAAFAVAYGLLALDVEAWAAMAPMVVLAGIGIGCAETAEHAAVAAAALEQLRGSAFGLLAGLQSLGNVVASTAAGVLWTVWSPAWAFGFLAIAMAAATVVLARPTPEGSRRGV